MERKPEDTGRIIRELYETLLSVYGPQGWWPLRSGKHNIVFTEGGYHPGVSVKLSLNEQFEISAGAVLTQNTAWNNAASAIDALLTAGMLSAEAVAAAEHEKLAGLIRSSGYFNQKAERLKILADYYIRKRGEIPERAELLRLKGIGPETADSILLYAWDIPVFVIDAYTRRLLSKITADESFQRMKYEDVRYVFEHSLAESVGIYQEYHALVVIHCKTFCRKVPFCKGCPLVSICKYREK